MPGKGRKGTGHAAGQHGKGRIWQRGRIWWIQFYVHGQPIRESSKSTKKAVAEKLLMKRLVAADEGTLTAPQRAILYEEMRERWVKSRLLNGESQKDLDYALARLDEFFEGLSTSVIDEDRIDEFKLARKATGASHATINRSLFVLNQMINLSAKRIKNPPKVRKFKEPPARQGFLADQDYVRLWSKLPTYLQPITEFAYSTGMRQGELEALTWKKVDRAACVIRLEPEDTKNEAGREIHYGVVPELVESMSRLWERSASASGLVFTRADGSPLATFRKAWNRACIKAGLGRMCWKCRVCQQLTEVEKQPWPPERVPEEIPVCSCGKTCHWHYEGLIFHDLRRTAIRNLRRAGVPESIVMTISGHKDRGVFERYNIKDSDDQRRAM
jgi:integrase